MGLISGGHKKRHVNHLDACVNTLGKDTLCMQVQSAPFIVVQLLQKIEVQTKHFLA